MSELRKSFGPGAIALLSIACCLSLPLVVAIGVGAAALVWGGAIVGMLVLAAAVAVLVARRRVRPLERRSFERREEAAQP